MYQTLVKNFLTLFVQYISRLPTTKLEEPTFSITLVLLQEGDCTADNIDAYASGKVYVSVR